MSRIRGVAVAALVGSLAAGLIAEAGTLKVDQLDGTVVLDQGRIALGLQTRTQAARAPDHGSTIAADSGGLWIAERNAGALIRTGHAGELRSKIDLHVGLGELLLDSPRASLYVADRTADTLLRYSVSGDQATQTGTLSLPEPHALALTPDGATLLVTSVANHELIAVDSASMQIRWRIELAPEPRAVAVSSDGRWALVGFISSDAVARVELATQKLIWHALAPRDLVEIESDDSEWGPSEFWHIVEGVSRFEVPNDVGRRHVRNAFAITFLADGAAAIAHHVATPQMELKPAADRRDSYGGGAASVPPIEYGFTRIGAPTDDGLIELDRHTLSVHQPRALAYDAARDILYVGGYGDDELAAIGSASNERPQLLWTAWLGRGAGCGLDGIAFAGDQVWAHCELARAVVRIDLDPERDGRKPVDDKTWVIGPELAPSLRSPEVERGAELFRRGEAWMLGGPLACSSCHPEGRCDGLTWRLGKSILQTPMLAGRVHETGPYKWTGEDPNLKKSFEHTLERIGGNPTVLSRKDYEGLEAYITSLAAPRPPVRERDADALARGRALFERECSSCHAGERLTDRQRYAFATTLAEVDTPSLVGLAHTAPYYHDGSAPDLFALLDDRGSIHDMVDTSVFTDEQRRDLVTYLEAQ